MKAEILAPAGDENTARIALSCGADAVYLGLSQFSARSSAENFGFDALERTVRFAHLLGGKVYVCLNTLVKDSETDTFLDSVKKVWEIGADAILMQDIFLGKRIKSLYPELVLHLSTQAGCCNEYGARLAKECGFSRVVLARETPLDEIKKIASIIETEVFVQGALCTCFSGQCYLSSFAGNNSGNRGRCKQPCRKKYSVDRAGYDDFSYALSPADLCVGERIEEFLEAGVISLKIEGRMRRPEYVAAAVRYYSALLSESAGERELSDLKRAYNRGDYTHGLAFGQERFLSRSVQGHIGERVGFLEQNGLCKSEYSARKGDGFKILRDGKELCGAIFRESGKGGFYLSASEKLRRGDEVRLTTDSSLGERVFTEKKRKITLSLSFLEDSHAIIECGDFVIRGQKLEKAKRAPLKREEIEACFQKTDGLPFELDFEEIELGNVFLPKSALNALRRNFFEELVNSMMPVRLPLTERTLQETLHIEQNNMTAVMSGSLRGLKADILIYKPSDYLHIDLDAVKEGDGVKFLYLPPFFTGEELKAVERVLPYFEGIYCDGTYGLPFSKANGKKFFAGTGFNLTNRFAVSEVKAAGADYYALSKELNVSEQDALTSEGAFVLSGSVKVMDICYCPFERNCKTCDRRDSYTVKDEEGRRFPLRRYSGKGCRFELYNCAPLVDAHGRAGRLLDMSVKSESSPTKGHTERSML